MSPGTRKSIFADIEHWVASVGSETDVLWLVGPVGVGKSAISRQLCQNLDRHDPRLLIGCFFFWRSDNDRNTLKAFVPTIAYRLSMIMPSVGEIISRVVSRDPAVLDYTLEDQWEALVIQPLLQVFDTDTVKRSLIVVDGLDECDPPSDQQRLLRLLLSSYVHDLRGRLAIIVASRPESHIASEIDILIHNYPAEFRLPHMILTETEESRSDMHLILNISFNDIRRRRASVIGNRNWPPEGTIERIVNLANGQFIYTLTIIRWLKEEDGNPVKRLDAIFHRCSDQKARAFAPLDQLYNLILTAACNRENGDLVLPCLFMLTYNPHMLTNTHRPFNRLRQPRLLGAFFKKDASDIRLILQPLHSTLMVPDHDDGRVEIYHKSFSEYLNDKTRSGTYCIQDSMVIGQVLLQALTPDVTLFQESERYWGIRQWLFLPYTLIQITPGLLDSLPKVNAINWLRENCLVLWPYWSGDKNRSTEFRLWLGHHIPKGRQDVLHNFPPDLFDKGPYMSLGSWARDLRLGLLPLRSTLLLFLGFWLHSIYHNLDWYESDDLLRLAIQHVGLLPAEKHTCTIHKIIISYQKEWQEWLLMVVLEQHSLKTISSLVSFYDEGSSSVIRPIFSSIHVLYAFSSKIKALNDYQSHFFWNCLDRMQRLKELVPVTRWSFAVLIAIVKWALNEFLEEDVFLHAGEFTSSGISCKQLRERRPELDRRRKLSLWYIEQFRDLVSRHLQYLVAGLKG